VSNHGNAADGGGTLWIVATPIGTLGDFPPRARDVLEGADQIFAEDTRRAGRLLSHIEVAAGGRLRSLHEHNESDRSSLALDTLVNGGSVVLMSDAGTPVLSDPGFLLVRAARQNRLRVASVPGPSSFTAALAASGQPPLPATLAGFLPARSGARVRRIAELAEVSWTLVVLLSPHRLAAELEDLCQGLGGERPATLLAEISKLHERAVMANLAELARCEEIRRPRGEYVVVVGPSTSPTTPSETDPEQIRRAYAAAIAEGLPRKEALKAVASRLGVGRREVFNCLIQDENDD
jgi:16S rRNA (cytidine1402-2'-O)-methyltransferase